MNRTAATILLLIAWSSITSAEVEEGKYTTLDGAVTIALPEGVKRNDIREQADGQGITSRCMLVPNGGPISGIYSTKIRAEFPKTDDVLHRTAGRYRQNIRAEDGSTLEHIEKVTIDGRLFLLSIVRHMEQGNATRLEDRWLKADLLIRGDVIEARLYAVHNGYFLEFKRMLLPSLALNMGPEDENMVATAAIRGVIQFACTSTAVNDNERQKLLAYKVRDDYIVGVYKDPSLEISPRAP